MKTHLYTIVAVVAMVAGCAILRPLFSPFADSSEEILSSFNHAIHKEKSKLDCTDCHGEPTEVDKVAMPDFDRCERCHSTEEKRTPEYLSFVKSRTVEGEIPWITPSSSYQEAIFSHKKHLKNDKAQCKDCHGDIENSTSILTTYFPKMADCIDCHEQKESGPTDKCASCHKETRRDIKPESHKNSRMWQQIHGENANEDKKRCFYCHTDNTCFACHQITPPLSHDTQWRHGGHGYMAEVDRERCQMCHSNDSCVRCHESTRPMSHTGSWGRPGLFHCVNCHFPLADNGCTACHRNAPSHSTAPRMPVFVPAHSFASDCFTCHFPGGGGATLKHPHGTDPVRCLNCHQRP